jgi:hypothetical protein
MIDSTHTDPAIIRATYTTRGRNRKLTIQKVESLGVASSQAAQVSPTAAGAALGVVVTTEVIDRTLTNEPGFTYEESQYGGGGGQFGL